MIMKKRKTTYKVMFTIVENITNKVLKIETHSISAYKLNTIGDIALTLNDQYFNAYVLIKIY